MNITLNGKPHTHRGDGTLADLLREVGATRDRVAVLVDGNVITATQYAILRLRAGMVIEIIIMAGGG